MLCFAQLRTKCNLLERVILTLKNASFRRSRTFVHPSALNDSSFEDWPLVGCNVLAELQRSEHLRASVWTLEAEIRMGTTRLYKKTPLLLPRADSPRAAAHSGLRLGCFVVCRRVRHSHVSVHVQPQRRCSVAPGKRTQELLDAVRHLVFTSLLLGAAHLRTVIANEMPTLSLVSAQKPRVRECLSTIRV